MTKTCPSCGMELDSSSKFCTRCGNLVTDQNNIMGSQPVGYQNIYTTSTGASGFISLGEGYSFSLKNGRLMNVLSGEGFVKEDAVLTDKRLYYSASSGIINKNSHEEIVNIADITGTKIADYKPYSFFIIAGLALLGAFIFLPFVKGVGFICIILAIFWFLSFFIFKKSYLRIEYAGGYIGFSVKKYGIQNVREFQRQIYIAKEKLSGWNRL